MNIIVARSQYAAKRVMSTENLSQGRLLKPADIMDSLNPKDYPRDATIVFDVTLGKDVILRLKKRLIAVNFHFFQLPFNKPTE